MPTRTSLACERFRNCGGPSCNSLTIRSWQGKSLDLAAIIGELYEGENHEKPSLREITKQVAKHFRLKVPELTGTSRRQGIVHPPAWPFTFVARFGAQVTRNWDAILVGATIPQFCTPSSVLRGRSKRIWKPAIRYKD